MDLFRELSVAEATVLATLMTRHDAAVGEVILRQGETADALFLIDSGEAGLRLRLRADKAETVATLGPGECFGEMAVLTGGNQVADVVALTPVTLLRVSTADYARYLACLPEVQLRVSLVALARAGEILRRRPAGRMGTSSSSPRPRRQLGRKVSRCSLMRT